MGNAGWCDIGKWTPKRAMVWAAFVSVIALSWATVARADVGSNWTLVKTHAEWPARLDCATVAYAGELWILGGTIDSSSDSANDVWSSSDGITWTEVTPAANWAPRATFSALTFNGQLWVLGGWGGASNDVRFSDVWSSTDGATWTQVTAAAPWAARNGQGAVVYGGKMWIMGGGVAGAAFNDVWSSADGATWTQVTAAAPWSPRTGLAVVAFNNRMWVLGGFNNQTLGELGDVWSSADGVTWTLEASPPWSARDSAATAVYDTRLFLVGGYPDSNDVWDTSDGATWTNATGAADWLARFGQTGVVFNNKLWSMGGVSNGVLLNDVWYTSVTGAIAGRVTDGVTHTPVTCAAVEVSAPSLSIDRVTSADLNGEFRVDDLPVGSYSVTAFAPGYANKTVSSSVAGGSRVFADLALTVSNETTGVQGVVTDSAPPHEVIPGVKVVAMVSGNPVATTYTCAEGRYELLGLPAKSTSVTLEFSSEAYTTKDQTVALTAGTVVEADTELTKSFPGTGALAGVVRQSVGGTAIAGARVTIEGLGDLTETSDSTGAYAFSSVPPGTYTVRASARGFGGQTQYTDVGALGAVSLDFSLPGLHKGDVNEDGSVNATDVQLVINAALGLPTSYNCDVSLDGVVNAVDVQLVINAALGLR